MVIESALLIHAFISSKLIKDKDGKIDVVLLALYFDDILWFSNSLQKESLAKRYKVDDMGEVSYVLGMSAKRNLGKRTLTFNQPKYLEGVLKRFGKETCKQVSTSLQPGRRFESLPENVQDEKTNLHQICLVQICCKYELCTALQPVQRWQWPNLHKNG